MTVGEIKDSVYEDIQAWIAVVTAGEQYTTSKISLTKGQSVVVRILFRSGFLEGSIVEKDWCAATPN